MTYVAGIAHPRFTMIICDMRATLSKGSGVNQALKSGMLFEGAIYGGSGSEFGIRNFVTALKERLRLTNPTVAECWEELQRRAALLEDRDDFDLLISSRHTGVPTLFLLSSRTRTVVRAGEFYTLGSGRALLDNPLKAFCTQSTDLLARIPDEDVRDQITPYAYCHWLTEFALGYEQEVLEESGVGGLFHFLRQTTQYDERQGPAVYVACGMIGADIHCLFHRIFFFAGMLIHEHPPTPWGDPGSTHVSVSSSETPGFAGLDESERQQWLRYAQQAGADLPPYQYIGFLSADPVLRSHLMFAASNKGKFLWHPRVGLSPWATKMIRQMFEQNLPLSLVLDAAEGGSQDMWVDVPKDTGATGIERHWGIVLAAPSDRPRCLFELADGSSGASFRWFLHVDGTVEFCANDSDGRVIFARTRTAIPMASPVCLGSSLLLLPEGTIATIYINGETTAEQGLDERFRFNHNLIDFEDWTNRSASEPSVGDLGLLRALMYKDPLAPDARRRIVDYLKASFDDSGTNCAWFMRGAYGRSSPGLTNMTMTGNVLATNLRDVLERARSVGEGRDGTPPA